MLRGVLGRLPSAVDGLGITVAIAAVLKDPAREVYRRLRPHVS
jgi:hypothetical protein